MVVVGRKSLGGADWQRHAGGFRKERLQRECPNIACHWTYHSHSWPLHTVCLPLLSGASRASARPRGAWLRVSYSTVQYARSDQITPNAHPSPSVNIRARILSPPWESALADDVTRDARRSSARKSLPFLPPNARAPTIYSCSRNGLQQHEHDLVYQKYRRAQLAPPPPRVPLHLGICTNRSRDTARGSALASYPSQQCRGVQKWKPSRGQ